MDAALGAPGKMAEQVEELTPMMRQYHDLCARYDDCLLLFQVGDFYEAFCDAAETVARLCEITLTKREDSTGRYPMAGVPIDSAESYIETLLDAGYRIAVADQVQDPAEATGVVDRAVTRIVTPGTLTEAELLRGDDNNFVACLTRGGERFGLAVLDVSTGDFYATGPASLEAVRDEVGRFSPAEVVVGPDLSEGDVRDVVGADCMVTPYERGAFAPEAARALVAEYFGDPDTLLAVTAEVRACGALLAYAEYARGGEAGRLEYLTHLTRYDPREYMLLDAVALRSLEVFERRHVTGAAGTALVDILDETASALGRRRLHDWLRRPLLDPEEIDARLDAVEELVGAVTVRETLHERLYDVYDIERLITRISRGRANARDLRSLKATLDVIPDLRAALDGAESERLSDLHAALDDCPEIRDLVETAIQPEPPIELTEGGLIREGYDADLDALRATEREGKAWIDDLQAAERERTGIGSLKVGYNQVHGYYIEVTNPNLEKVPDDYQRRQTLKNSERFYTPELKEREDEIVRAETRADDLEYDRFTDVRARVGEQAPRVQRVASAVATLDALVSLATVAAEHGYTRPTVGADSLDIAGGRHPVVERTEERFVPNGLRLDSTAKLAVVTGPNMAGKSTYMRQVALIAVLAQVGSFVPAGRADLPVLDRVFTRVGASDDIAGGRSTFMVEMTELAAILRDATEDSLVLLDEVGRGTSTADGFAIARAVTEHLHDETGAYTLFATHHHDLTAVADALPRARNLHFDADRSSEGVEFRHDVSEGAATASYGVDVARLAGVPEAVVSRSRALLDGDAAVESEMEATEPGAPETNGYGAVDGEVSERVARELTAVDIASTTPLEALQKLSELKRLADEEE
jgi:DNA mismatch repair protein MutS